MANRLSSLMGAQDMTVGNPKRNLLIFSIPLLIGNIAQQLYSTADAIIVGNYIGDNALAAVGATNPIINLLLILFMAIATGAGVMVSQYFGAKDRESLSNTIGMSIVMIVITSLIITVVGIALTPTLLRLTSTPEEIFESSRQYLTIILLGIIGGGFYNILSGVLRGLGDSINPLIYLLVCTAINVVLDIVFISRFGMGVDGAAWATIIAQAVSAVLCVIRLRKMKQHLDLSAKRLRLFPALTKRLIQLGIPAGLTQGIFSLSMIFVQRLTNSMGADIVAMSTAIMRVDGFAMMPNFTFGMAASTFVGQNIGARRIDRVIRGERDALQLSLIVSCMLTLALLLFSRQMIGWFTSTETIINYGVRAIRILAVGYIAVGINQVYTGIMRGAGDTMPAMWISIITTVVLRIPIAYLIAHNTRSEQWPQGSPDALYISLLVSWVMGAVLTYTWYRRGAWKKKAAIYLGDDMEGDRVHSDGAV